MTSAWRSRSTSISPRSSLRADKRDGGVRGVPFQIGRRDGDRLVGPHDVARERRDDLQRLSRRQRRIDRERRLREALELNRPSFERGGLRLRLRRLAEELDEHADLRPQDVGLRRREDVVDGAERIAPRGMRVVRIRRHEDDRGVLRARPLPQERGRLEAVHRRHVHVEQDDRELVLEEQTQGLPSGRRRLDLEAGLGEDRRRARAGSPACRRPPGSGPGPCPPCRFTATARSGGRAASGPCRPAWRDSPRRRPGASFPGLPSWLSP